MSRSLASLCHLSAAIQYVQSCNVAGFVVRSGGVDYVATGVINGSWFVLESLDDSGREFALPIAVCSIDSRTLDQLESEFTLAALDRLLATSDKPQPQPLEQPEPDVKTCPLCNRVNDADDYCNTCDVFGFMVRDNEQRLMADNQL